MLMGIRKWLSGRRALTVVQRKDFTTVFLGNMPIARIVPRSNGYTTLRTIQGDETYTSELAALDRCEELLVQKRS